MPLDFERHCWAEINLDHLRHNFSIIQTAAAPAAVTAVVKANAYGHGDTLVAQTLQSAGAARFAVSSFPEGVRLRRAGIRRPILIMGHTSPQQAVFLRAHHFSQCVYSLAYAQSLSTQAVQAGVRLRVHFKLDTGMGRLGFTVQQNMADAVHQIAQAYALPGLVPVGLFTHFAVSDSTQPDDVAHTQKQFNLFTTARATLAKQGITFRYAHCCNSGGVCSYPLMRLNAVRPGIILYGCPPSGNTTLTGLRPVCKFKTLVTMVKTLPKGGSVSYGRLFTAPHDMTVATLAAGYADGYPRLLSNQGVVSVNGQPANIVGRVCMDQCVIDVTGIKNVQPGSEVTLFGGSGSSGADTTHQAAEKCGSISYELLCNMNRRVPRVYTQNNQEIQVVDYLQEMECIL